MIKRPRRLVWLVLIGLLSAGAGQQDPAFGRWRVKGRCIHNSVVHFPDHDAVSLQKRDAEVDACLKAAQLPPIDHLAAPAPAQPAIGAAPPDPGAAAK